MMVKLGRNSTNEINKIMTSR